MSRGCTSWMIWRDLLWSKVGQSVRRGRPQGREESWNHYICKGTSTKGIVRLLLVYDLTLEIEEGENKVDNEVAALKLSEELFSYLDKNQYGRITL